LAAPLAKHYINAMIVKNPLIILNVIELSLFMKVIAHKGDSYIGF